MAASALPLPRYDARSGAAFFGWRNAWTPELMAMKRDELQRLMEGQDGAIEDTRRSTDKFIADLREVVQADPSYDLDDAYDLLADAAKGFSDDRKTVTAAAQAALREAGPSNHEALILMNEALREFLVRFDMIFAVMRDARWNLMALRAELQPSEGVGPIHGSGEPPSVPGNAT